jgi:hypothetical protein
MTHRRTLLRASPVTFAGTLLGIAVLICLGLLGKNYTRDCIAGGGELEKCWDKGLSIAGMGAGGPLSAGVVFGFVVGSINKEREKREQYKRGYWTFNPELRDQPTTTSSENGNQSD